MTKSRSRPAVRGGNTAARPSDGQPDSAAPPSGRWRVLIVDDHPLMRRGFRDLFSRQNDLEVCGEADSVTTALDAFDASGPDLVVVDLSLKNGSGLDLVGQIRERDPSVATLIWSMHDEDLVAERALRAGALGYVCKDAPGETLVEAARTVLSGSLAVSDGIAQRLLRSVGRGPSRASTIDVESLSDRELEAFELIGHGLSTRQISDRLHLSINTIDSHCESIKKKLGLDNAVELVRRAVLWVLES